MKYPNWIKTAERKVFKATDSNNDDPFFALSSCWKWLEDNGYEYGSTQVMAPFAVCKKEKISEGQCIPKWRHLDQDDIKSYIDGLVIYSRGEDAVLFLKKDGEDDE